MHWSLLAFLLHHLYGWKKALHHFKMCKSWNIYSDELIRCSPPLNKNFSLSLLNFSTQFIQIQKVCFCNLINLGLVYLYASSFKTILRRCHPSLRVYSRETSLFLGLLLNFCKNGFGRLSINELWTILE